LYQNKDYVRALFYIRRINNGNYANAETLWLGIKVERQLGNHEAVSQLASQLEKRFLQSKEMAAYRRGDFNE
jgi:type IV pilus assembly protein PilF